MSIDFIFSQKPTGWVTVQEKIFRNMVNREKKVVSLEGTLVGREFCKAGAAAEAWAWSQGMGGKGCWTNRALNDASRSFLCISVPCLPQGLVCVCVNKLSSH